MEDNPYDNPSHGDYEPPSLFPEAKKEPEETPADEDEEDILARIRRNMAAEE